MEGEADSAWVVSARGVDQEDIGRLRECAHGGLQQGALAQREQPRLVGRAPALPMTTTVSRPTLAAAHAESPACSGPLSPRV
jgi:hypothetical protein